MSRCPITYMPCESGERYSEEGLRLIHKKLTTLKDFPYTQEEQRQEALARASKMSIQGVQPKLSVILDIKKMIFRIVDTGGHFIIKPQNLLYHELPENEDLSIKLASSMDIKIPLRGLVYTKDGSLSYFIRRFDRFEGKKIAVEDFAQLSGKNRETKYSSSIEQVIKIINMYATFPAIEKIEFFKRFVFNFLIGNEDMHLKNYSLISRHHKTELSPAYDLINTTIVIPGTVEESALPLDGRKKNLSRRLIFTFLGRELCELSETSMEKVIHSIRVSIPQWNEAIGRSFLSMEMKKKYREILDERCTRLELC